MKKLLLLMVFIALVGAGAYWVFLREPHLNVKLSLEMPSEVMMGESFEAIVQYENNSSEILKNANLAVTLSDNIYFVGISEDQRVTEDGLGNVPAGSSSSKTYKLIALRETDTAKLIEVKLLYSLESSSGQFESRAKEVITVGSPAVTLGLESPESVFSGEEFELTLDYKNHSKESFEKTRLRIDYPPAFTFSESDPDPSEGKNIWDLKTLIPDSEGKIKVKGSAMGEEDASFVFNVVLMSEKDGEIYDIQRQSSSVNIKKAPLSVKIRVNNSDKYVAEIGDNLNYELAYKNNSDITLQNIVIKASLVGELFELGSLSSNGSLNSLNKTITWNVGNSNELASLAPGEEKKVDFRIRLKDSFPIRKSSDKNYVLKIGAQIESPTVPTGVSATRTVSLSNLETKVAGDLELDAVALYKDSSFGSANTGPFPPKANVPTQYTIRWRLVNYSTDVSSVKVSAFLQADSKFTGKIKSNIDSVPQYNSRTGEIYWDIKNIPANRGVLGEPIEAIFQIENTPATNQIGDYVQFLNSSRVSAKDDFTGLALEDITPPLNTMLLGDPKITVDDRRVQP